MNSESPFSPENHQRKLDSPEQIGSTLKITALPTYLLACTVLPMDDAHESVFLMLRFAEVKKEYRLRVSVTDAPAHSTAAVTDSTELMTESGICLEEFLHFYSEKYTFC